MKQKVKPQGILDILTPGEFTDVMERHTDTLLTALGRNARFIRYIEQNTDTNRAITISPPDGFLWEVKAVIPATADGGADIIGMYFNQATGSNAIANLTCNVGMVTFPGKTIIIHSTDNLVFQAQGFIATIQLLVIEVPNSHEAQLLL